MKLPTKILILGMILSVPATGFAQRGGGIRSGGEFRGGSRGQTSREFNRGGSRFSGPLIYSPIPIWPSYLDPGLSLAPGASGLMSYNLSAYGTPYGTAYGTNVQEPVAVSSAPAPAADYVQALTNQVQELSAELQRLRYQQVAPTPVDFVPVRPLPGTTLVFRDSHRIEVHSYAIAGQTLTVLDKDNSAHIALADLDLDATKNVNQDNGVRFVVPTSR